MTEARFVRWAKYDGAHFVESDGQGGYSVYLHDEQGSYPFAVCGDGNDAAAIAAAFNRIRDLQAALRDLVAELAEDFRGRGIYAEGNATIDRAWKMLEVEPTGQTSRG